MKEIEIEFELKLNRNEKKKILKIEELKLTLKNERKINFN